MPPELDFADDDDPGSVEFFRLPDLPEVELLVAKRSARRWEVLHHTYTVCTMQALDSPAPWKYRGRLLDLRADSMMLMEPSEVHANVQVTAPATFRVLLIEPALMEVAASELGLSGTVHLRLSQVDAASHPQLRRAFLGLHASLERTATPLERESRLAVCMRLLLQQCAEEPVRPPAGISEPTAVLRARDFIEAHLTEGVRLQDLVEAAGAGSRFQLVRAFAATTGLPPHAYQIQRRIIAGRSMLARGVPAADVAAQMGFADQSHFTRHFHRVVGVPPATYARAMRAH